MKSVFLPQPSLFSFADPGKSASSAAISKWQSDVKQTTRQWLRTDGSITNWLEDYSRLRLDILHQNWHSTVPFDLRNKVTFILLGASARGEDTLSSDLDYALLLHHESASAADELRPYLYQFSQAMSVFGIEPCPGNVMATNPRWIGAMGQWRERIDSYFQYPSWENTRYLFMLIDSLPISFQDKDNADTGAKSEPEPAYGKSIQRESEEASFAQLWNSLRLDVVQRLSQSPYLCWEMAHLGIESPAAAGGRLTGGRLGAGRFGGWRSPSWLPARLKSIDVKTSLISPVLHSVRLLSVSNQIPALSTLNRLNQLIEDQVLDRTLQQAIQQSLHYGWKMRLHSALEKPVDSGDSDALIFAKMSATSQEQLFTHLQTVRKLVHIVHRRFRKPR